MKWSIVLLAILLLVSNLHAASYQYIRLGQLADVQTTPTAGTAMMGGGKDLDEAFRWLCGKAKGGDFLILRARGDDDYNLYVNGLCKANSVATLIVPSREAAQEPKVAEIIRQAEAVFIAGGDQSLYVRFWQGTPVQDAINANVAVGKPIGGTSAGLAILGEFAYGAMGDKADDADLASQDVLPNPFHPRITLVRDFLKVPFLEGTITDSHFAKRDRMGRTLGFLARLMQDRWSQHPSEIAIDERSAVLVEKDGEASVVGPGLGAYFLRPSHAPEVCEAGVELSFKDVRAHHSPRGSRFSLRTWSGNGGESYQISVEKGLLRSTKPGNAVY